jgi:hypothetical protein
MNIYYFIYYKIYVFFDLIDKIIGRKEPWAPYGAALIYSLLICFNIITLINLIEIYGRTTLFDTSKYRFAFQAFGGLIIISNLFYFLWKKRYYRIAVFYKKRYKATHDYIAIFYLLISLFLFFSSTVQIREKNISNRIDANAWYNK